MISQEFSIEIIPVHQQHTAALTVQQLQPSLAATPELDCFLNYLDHILSHEVRYLTAAARIRSIWRLGAKAD